tara:strand:- start:190 stop:432 length:243 start_codon:yes stop_codon:yes gene_type:complete
MKRKYLGILFIWLAVGLSVSGYFNFNPPKYEEGASRFLFKDEDERRFYTNWEAQHGKIFFQVTLIGSCLILGIGFFDRSK